MMCGRLGFSLFMSLTNIFFILFKMLNVLIMLLCNKCGSAEVDEVSLNCIQVEKRGREKERRKIAHEEWKKTNTRRVYYPTFSFFVKHI
jgi:hypothetical protein